MSTKIDLPACNTATMALVPEVQNFITGEWTTQDVERLMCYNTAPAAQEAGVHQRGAVLASTQFSFDEMTGDDFNHAWRTWAYQLNAGGVPMRVLVQDMHDKDRYRILGRGDTILEVTVFDRFFFGFGNGPVMDSLGQQMLRWSELLTTILPGSDIALHGNNLRAWLGGITPATPQHVVLLDHEGAQRLSLNPAAQAA